MEFKNQVANPTLSKKIKELNFKQESLFYWTELNGEPFLMIVKDFEGESIPEDRKDKFISAFTVSEIFPLLADEITIPKDTHNISDYVAMLLIEKLKKAKCVGIYRQMCS